MVEQLELLIGNIKLKCWLFAFADLMEEFGLDDADDIEGICSILIVIACINYLPENVWTSIVNFANILVFNNILYSTFLVVKEHKWLKNKFPFWILNSVHRIGKCMGF